MRRRRPVRLAACLLIAGCAVGGRVLAERPPTVDWRKAATEHDRARLRMWRQAWVEALAKVRSGGEERAIAADLVLFDPDRSSTGAALPEGGYRCRTYKLGGMDRAGRPFAAAPPVDCRVDRDGGSARFVTRGVQRIEGHLFAGTDARQVFLGTLALGDESRAMIYGRDAHRDMAGVVERIGERRWRLVLPYPGFESTLDVVEIVPAT